MEEPKIKNKRARSEPALPCFPVVFLIEQQYIGGRNAKGFRKAAGTQEWLPQGSHSCVCYAFLFGHVLVEVCHDTALAGNKMAFRVKNREALERSPIF